MRKILTFLAIIVVCAGCKNYQADIDNYLSYWSTQATIARYSFDPAAVQTDNEKIQNIPSSSDVNVILTVRNPKNFTFKMPQDPGAPADIVVFPTDVTGTAGGAPTQPTDYTLTQDSNSQLRLTYKKEFLQKYESVKKNIGPTITLYATDGRPFPGTFKLNVKVNTPPPNLTYWAIGKTAVPDGNGKRYYVLFLEAKGMDTTINASNLLHKDIKYLSIAEGSGTYQSIPLTVKADKSGFDISGAGGRLLAHTETAQLDSLDVDSGVTPDNISALSGGWIVRVKTDVEVKSPKKEYRFLLQDEAGLRSTEALRDSTSTNDKINRTNTQKISGGQDAWKNLKAAVAAAKDGDVIIIDSTITATGADGNSGAIEIIKKITIKGKNGAGTDMLDANSYHPDGNAPATPHRIFTIKSGGNLTLENLTLKNGKANGSGTDQDGGAIYNEGTLTIQNSNIENNMAVNGGGIYNVGTMTINRGIIGNATATTGNLATSQGGGIFLFKGDCTLDGVKIQNNTIGSSGKGSGIYLYQPHGATLTVTGAMQIGSSTANTNTVCLGYQSSQSAFVTAKGLATDSFINIEAHDYYSQKDKRLVKVPDDYSAAAYNTYFHLTSIPSGETYILNPNSADKELLLKKATVIGSTEQNPWKKLKAAVAAAKDGDVIIVDGTITATSDSGNNGEIAVTKSITIRGKSGAGTDILNANGTNGSKPAHRIFKVTDCDLTLEGLTLKGGMATDTETLGGGIYCNNSEKLTIKNCSIQDCTASSSGGGIYITTGASGQVNSTLILKDGARISGNSAKNGGGIAVDSAKVYMEGATTSIGGAHGDKNIATAYGGGVYVSDGIFTMSGGIITGNDALKGGGVYGGTKGEIIIKGSSEISENTATMSGTLAGGGIESDYKLTIKDSALIQQNHAPNGFGGGIASGQGAQFDFIGGKVTDNTAGSNGKGIYINSFMSNAYFKISGNVYVDSNNDVFLGGTQASEYAYITIIGTLTKTLVAPLTMNNTHGYGVGRVVVKGSENHSLTEQDAAKFTVTPQDASGVSKFWQINSTGKLEVVPQP